MDAASAAVANLQGHLYKQFVFGMDGVRPHAPLTSDGDRCRDGPRNTLTFGQAVVHYVASMVAAGSRGAAARGLLIWHSTGSGKSCTAVAVAHAFWNSRRPIFYVTTAALRDKTEAELFACASDLFAQQAAAVPVVGGRGHSAELRARRNPANHARGVFTTAKGFKDGLQVITYAVLAHWIKKRLVPLDSVLILDEVHNLYYPLPTQQEEHKQLMDCLLRDQPSLSDAKVFIMTATPGSTPGQLFKLLNIIRDRRKPPIVAPDATSTASIDAFMRSLVGMITYIDTNMDPSRFPTITQLAPQTSVLGDEQMQYYLQKVSETDDTEASYDALMRERRVSRYWLKARKASNSMFNLTPGGGAAADGNMLKHAEEFSAKLPLLLRNIAERPDEKHYVYSAFYERYGFGGHGVYMISKFLGAMGYEELTAEQAARPELLARGKRRFLMLTSSSLNSAKAASGPTSRRGSPSPPDLPVVGPPAAAAAGAAATDAPEPSSASSRAEKRRVNALLAVFNSPENARGELVGVILASQGYNEGIDLKAVRHVHLFEPLVEYNMELQAIGRAARHCSHAQLRKEHGEWTVQVHRYISDAPRDLVMRLVAYSAEMEPDAAGAADAANADQELMVEKIVYREARDRVREMRLYELCMKRAAVDCMLTRSFHGLEEQCMEDA